MNTNHENSWTETAAIWTVGAPLVLADRLRKRVKRLVNGAEEQAEELVREGRRQASDALADAREIVEDRDTRPYEERTVEELYALAQEREIEGRSQMDKAELVAALRWTR